MKIAEKAAKHADTAKRRTEVQEKFAAMTDEEQEAWRLARQAKGQNRKSETEHKRSRLQQVPCHTVNYRCLVILAATSYSHDQKAFITIWNVRACTLRQGQTACMFMVRDGQMSSCQIFNIGCKCFVQQHESFSAMLILGLSSACVDGNANNHFVCSHNTVFIGMQAMLDGQGIVIDLDFEKEMTESEIKSLCGQLQYSYSSNTRAAVPCHLHFTSLQARVLLVGTKRFTGMIRHAVETCMLQAAEGT